MASESRFRFDPRIKRELLGQRRSILIGVGSSAIAAALYGFTLPLVKRVIDILTDINAHKHQEDFQRLLQTCGLFILVFLVRYTFVRFQTY